jgi:hypothetical protein
MIRVHPAAITAMARIGARFIKIIVPHHGDAAEVQQQSLLSFFEAWYLERAMVAHISSGSPSIAPTVCLALRQLFARTGSDSMAAPIGLLAND